MKPPLTISEMRRLSVTMAPQHGDGKMKSALRTIGKMRSFEADFAALLKAYDLDEDKLQKTFNGDPEEAATTFYDIAMRIYSKGGEDYMRFMYSFYFKKLPPNAQKELVAGLLHELGKNFKKPEGAPY